MPPSSASDAKTKLAAAVDALSASPDDLDALASVAHGLETQGPKPSALAAYDALGTAAAESGHLALAIAAAKGLERVGGPGRAKMLVTSIVKIYASGSPRIDPNLKPRPPAPPPSRRDAPKDAKGDLVERAGTGITAAAKRAQERAGKGTKLPAVPLVHALDAPGLEKLIGAMRFHAHQVGDVVAKQGDDATSLYLVARGVLSVTRGEQELGQVRAGSFFGEIALLSGTRRTANVTCTGDVWLLEVPRAALGAAAQQSQALADTLADYARRRLLANTMRTSEIFRRLEPGERDMLIGRFAPQVFEPKATILRAGEEADRLHVVVSGGVSVVRGDAVIAELVAGDVFGEISLLARKPATADVVATTRTVTLSLDRAGFDDVAVKHPAVLAEVYKLVVTREAEQSASALVVSVDDDIVV